MHRRDFLKYSAFTPLVLQFSRAWAGDAPTTNATPPLRTLLLVELNGGNDGLNTVVPYADSRYYSARPNISIDRGQVLQLDEHVGFNPALQPLLPLWNQHQLAVVQTVGYPEPNRSHFRSIEIWDTGSDAEEYLQDGWLARALPGSGISRACLADAVVIGRNPQPVSGGDMRTLVVNDVETFATRGTKLAQIQQTTANPALAHLLQVQAEVHSAAAGLLAEAQKTPAPQGDFPTTAFGRSLEQAARLIEMDRAAPVIKVALGSFDTHANQRGQQDRLLAEFANGLAAFQTAMLKAGKWNDVLVLTYSEFGRRVAENGSKGTDHGTAAPHFLLGGSVKGGLYGDPPSLADLDDGDLRFTHDYRSVYNTVLTRWWNLPNSPFDTQRYPAILLV